MYVYNYRIFDRYDRSVASLAVLADERKNWRPHQFGYQLWGTEISFNFSVVKLLDYQQQWSALESNRNPFATVRKICAIANCYTNARISAIANFLSEN